MSILFIVIFFKSILLSAQSIPLATPPSPNAAATGSYNQIPVSLFNGIPQIDIPIGKVETGAGDLDISLSYHAGGIKPDQHSGWAGLGWNLNAGGIITRIMNGAADERIDPEVWPQNALSYYDHPDGLAGADWYSSAALNAYSASTGPQVILSPDEFMFNFNGYSGSFLYDHQGKWQIKSTQGLHISVKEELQNDFVLEQKKPGLPSLSLKRIFYKFTITTPDGTQYVFGGTPQSIEFSRRSTGNDSFNNGVTADSWYLTKIITKNGQETNLTYERGDIIGTWSSTLSIYANRDIFIDRSTDVYSTLTIANPVYLKSIETDLQKVSFARSSSNELQYVITFPTTNDLYFSIDNYADLRSSDSYPNTNGDDLLQMMKCQKLDSISFYGKPSSFLNKVAFSYTENPSSRLILTSAQKIGSNETEPAYRFGYNNIPLPVYNSRMLDHWGYYNGVNMLADFPAHDWTYEEIGRQYTAYDLSKASNPALMEAGNLVLIQYPSGGKTVFEYEAHEYGAIAKRYPFELELKDNTKAGGLRIKKITQLNEVNQSVSNTEYKYVTGYNLGRSASSGILSGKSGYMESMTVYGANNRNMSYFHWYDRMVQPLSNTNGNHVTYTEVVEKQADGGYTIYNYSNHNQQKYRDQPALNQAYNTSSRIELDPNTSMELDRGKLLRMRKFRSDNVLRKEMLYQYDESASRMNMAIRFRNIQQRTIGYDFITDKRVTAYLSYYFPRLLTQETQRVYDTNGLNPDTLQKKFSYDPVDYNLLSVRYANSKGDSIITRFKYPGNMLTQDPTGVYHEMYSKHIISPQIEQTSFVNTTQTLYKKVNFHQPYSGIFVPKTTEEKVGNGRLTTKLTYSDYDAKGNLLSFSDKKGVKTNYLWSYYGRIPVAEIVNAEYQDIVNIAGNPGIENLRDSRPDKTAIDNFLAPLKTALPNAYISSSSYQDVTGKTSETDVKGKTNYFDYDGLQRPKNVLDQNSWIRKSLSYNYRPQTALNTYYNVEKSGTFIRQACAPTLVGTAVVYNVPAGKHQSQISQEEADRLAQKDLEVNGPLYANKYGQCVLPCDIEGRKMVGGICETGTKIYAGSQSQGNSYLCNYYYRWSDGSVSEYYTELNSNPCFDEGGL